MAVKSENMSALFSGHLGFLMGITADENNQVSCAAHHSEQSLQILSA